MSEVVERVARAIYEDMEAVEISFGNSAVWDKVGPYTRRKYMEAAIAAIEAMRVPTEAMQIQGMVAMVEYNRRLDGPPKPHEECVTADDWMGRGCSIGKAMYTGEEISGAWAVMISEALK